ncbi:MAG: rod shape-determining protein RodA, partial [Coriobacteriales bacterium]|nr:rod shape-determining protein RodA [Coriobacteriales bacterium]
SPLIPGLGVEVNGARNWINIFGQQIQPGEFAKLLIIIAMAALVARYRGKLQSGKDYLFCLGVMLLPVFCVVLQPDLGTGLVFLAIGLTMLFVGGANRWWLALTVICGALAIVGILAADPLLDNLVGHDVLIKEYQINRLLVFMNEDLDPAGLGYNLRQAKIAIGSAGFRGAGFMQGTQSSLGFLPEAPTDFIFCVLAEEFGFLGSLALISLYTLLVLISLRTALKADAFGALLIGGGLGMWVFQILENIGMTCGMMPITGIPLPFMSYGSSFMMINFCMVGLIMSVSMRTAWQAMQKPAIDPVAIDRAASERRW